MERLNGKVAVVTGAGGGIGRALAGRLAADGAAVVVADLQNFSEAAAGIAKQLRPAWSCRSMFPARRTSRAWPPGGEAFGRIDILVNNAAVFQHAQAQTVRGNRRRRVAQVLDVNVIGAALCARACVPHMRKGGYGRIINLASGAPLKGVPLFLHYISSKGAVIAMTRGLARELGKDSITVNALAPGFTLSETVAKDAAHVQAGERSRASRHPARQAWTARRRRELPRKCRRRLHDRPDAGRGRRLGNALGSEETARCGVEPSEAGFGDADELADLQTGLVVGRHHIPAEPRWSYFSSRVKSGSGPAGRLIEPMIGGK